MITGIKSKDGIVAFGVCFSGDSFSCQKIGELFKLDRKGVFVRLVIEPLPPLSINKETGEILDANQLPIAGLSAIENNMEMDSTITIESGGKKIKTTGKKLKEAANRAAAGKPPF